MSRALVFSIEEFAVFDGPGIRTTVFVKGCPLRCEWCHNPEGQSITNEILRSPNGCLSCGLCESKAKIIDERLSFTEESISVCPRGLLRYCAEEYSPSELYSKIEKNLSILNSSGGGVTFSGGEPTSNAEFLLECLALFKDKIHRAVQTCGFCSAKLFKTVLDNCDYVLYDLKIIDEELHKRYTGVTNKPIIDNFLTLVSSGREYVIRMPLIPGVTDTEENVRAVASLLKANGVDYIELLPYNKLAGSKYKLAGREYTPSFDASVPVEFRTEIFEEFGIKYKVM